MPDKERILVSWSGGKDSALALHETLKTGRYEIAALLTTVTKDYDRISMHGVRRALLEQQVLSLGFPLEKVLISPNSSNEEYETRMKGALEKYRDGGVSSVVFGDLFLEDIRKYREERLGRLDMSGIFPLWKKDTTKLARTFLERGFRAVICCVDAQTLDGKFVGREFDERFLSDLPATVDPCGENGEFHSFVYEGPIFARPIHPIRGEIVLRDDRFWYCDLLDREIP